MRMTRYWMSGCMALVLLAAGRWPQAAEREDAEQSGRGWVTITSKHSLDRTVKQLERAARAQGLPVVADVAADATGKGKDGRVATRASRNGTGRVLVLGRTDGHTPVVQQAGDASPVDLPLRVLLTSLPDGSTRVMFADPGQLADQSGLPEDIRHDLAALPRVVTAALQPGADSTADA